ncbi:MAG: efflux transporter, family, subunit [Phycisphaerales bacterium]|nr:efflux transporter, family, subunit [Phycisphaerales bacterium]
MEAELHKLRIDRSEKVSREEASRLPWVIVAVVLLLIVAAIAWKFSGSREVELKTVRVRIPEGAEAAADPVVLNATGYIVAAHKIELASKAIGRVAWVGVEMGDKIQKGEVLVRLEDDEYRARVAQEQGQLDNAKAKLAELEAGSRPQEIATVKATLDKSLAELAVAETNFKRVADLKATRAVSNQQVDDAEALVASRRAQVDSDRQQLELSKVGPRKEQVDAQKGTVRQLEGGLALAMVDLDNTVIRSPVPATVLSRNVEVGEFVTTGFVGENGAKGFVVSIADLNDLRVDLDVSQNDFAKVLPKQPCWIVTDAYPDRRYAGLVDLISPEANRQKATVQVRVKVSNPDELLRPDMNATVSFLSPSKLAATQKSATLEAKDRPALRVPVTAVRDGAVFTIESGKAVRRTVTAGTTVGEDVEIRKGLIGGEDLIIDPPADLQEGAAVRSASAETR